MLTKLYIGPDCIDIQEKINLQYSVCDWREFNSGGSNNSFNFKIPLAKLNGFILKNPSVIGASEEVTAKANLFLNGLLMLRGKLKVTQAERDMAEVTIDGNEWTELLAKNKLSDLDFSSENFTLTFANIETSWAGSDKFYRYPLVNFGALARGQTGSTAQWDVTDFSIWFRVKSILEKIFAKYTIVSDFFDTAFAKELYMSGKRKVVDADFLNNIKFDAYITADSDNETEVVIDPAATDTATLDCSTYANRVQINTETLDEGGDYTTDKYTVPGSGTYRFKINLKVGCSWHVSNWPLNSGSIALAIVKQHSAVDTEMVSFSDTGATATTDWNKDYTLDTGFQYLEAGDLVWVKCTLVANGTNSLGEAESLIVYLWGGATNRFYNTADNWCLFQGLNETVVVSDNMPDMTQLDFLKGLKHAFNLRFFFDSLNGKLYIEPADTFYTNDEYDLTDFVTGDPVIKHFIVDFCKKLWLQWKADSSDKLHKDYQAGSKTPPLYKEIVFTNNYMKDEIEVSENPAFSVCLESQLKVMASSFSVIAIHDPYDEAAYTYPPSPIKSFTPRLGSWAGLTAGLSWYFDTTLKTTYPKMAALDYATLYTSYFLKTLHYIETGKMLECNVKARSDFINSLITVIGSITTLGWRTRYKVEIDGIPYYFILSRVVTDGQTAKLELILKQ